MSMLRLDFIGNPSAEKLQMQASAIATSPHPLVLSFSSASLRKMAWKYILLTFLAIVSSSNALTNLTTTGCVDPSGLQQCMNAVSVQITACVNGAEADASQQEILGCGCANYIGNYNCYAAHCWNRVNECEYQTYITDYLAECLIAKPPIPYFPIPDNAPDSCSCNVGKINLAISASVQDASTCINNSDGPDAATNVQRNGGCDCCEISSSLSRYVLRLEFLKLTLNSNSMYALCPETDPNLIGLPAIQQLETIATTPFDTCSPFLSEFNCVSDLGFAEVQGNIFYNPSNLPLTGTATLSNLPGTVTAPASGAVFTYTNGGDGQVYAITAANVKGGSKGGGSGGSPAAATAGASSSSGEKTDTSRGFFVVASILCLVTLF